MIALQSLIERAARLNPTGIATTYKGTDVTWADTEQRVASLASGLQHLGLSEGDRVGILSLNCATYYEALFAVPWAGFCVVPLNTRWAVPENNYAIGDSGTRAVLFDDAFSAQVEELRSALVCLEHCERVESLAGPIREGHLLVEGSHSCVSTHLDRWVPTMNCAAF